MLKLLLAVAAKLSVTVTVNVAVPVLAVTMPLSVPVELFNKTPAGSAPPVIDQVNGPVPPKGTRGWL